MSGRVGKAVDDAHVFHALAERGLDALDQPLHRILGFVFQPAKATAATAATPWCAQVVFHPKDGAAMPRR
jgi:hypothetical protein